MLNKCELDDVRRQGAREQKGDKKDIYIWHTHFLKILRSMA